MRPIILNNLRLLTGEDFGNSARMWLSWWKDHQENFQIPSLRDAEAAEAARGERKDGNRTKASF